jgi:hypothetical protein
MRKKIGLSRILKRNPTIDLQALKRSREMLRELRSRGVGGHGYELALPFASRRVSTERDVDQDPRTFQLRRPSELA